MKDKERIEEIVLTRFKVNSKHLRSTSRRREYVDARKALSYILRKNTSMSFHQIGRFIQKDHSSVVRYVTEAENLLTYDKQFIYNIKAIELELCYIPLTSTQQDRVNVIMNCIVWNKKGATKLNLEKMMLDER